VGTAQETATLAQQPVAVHGVEIELGRVDHEVVIQVLRIRQRFQQTSSPIQGDLGLTTVSEPCPRLGLLADELLPLNLGACDCLVPADA
jgi:hypothetical protein